MSHCIACLSCSPPNIHINISPLSNLPMLKSKFYHMLPSNVLMSELGVLNEHSRSLLNFSSCSIFHLYLLHFRTSYLLSSQFLPEGRKGKAWDHRSREFSSVPPRVNVVFRTTHPLSLLSLSPPLSLSLSLLGFKQLK
jgi:hypothetical protein